nr:unnamed protein product [Spirometra erinaceieuropaei]
MIASAAGVSYHLLVDIIVQRHFNSVEQFADRILNDTVHSPHNELMAAKSLRPMRRCFRHIPCGTSAYRNSLLPFLARRFTPYQLLLTRLQFDRRYRRYPPCAPQQGKAGMVVLKTHIRM